MQVGILLLIAAVSLCCFQITAETADTGSGGIVSVMGATGVICVVTIGLRRSRRYSQGVRKHGPVSTLWLALVTTLLTLVVPVILAYLSGATESNKQLESELSSPQAALWLLAVFVVLAAAIYVPLVRSDVPGPSLNRRSVSPRNLRIAFALGMAISLANLLARGRSIDGRTSLPSVLAPFEQALAYGPALTYVAIGGLASSNLRVHRLTAVAMTIITAIIGVGDGFFKPAYWAVLVLVIGSGGSLRRHLGSSWRNRTRRLVYLVLGVVVMVGVIPVVQATRASGTSGSFVGDLEAAYSESWGRGLGTGWEYFVDKSVGRQAGVLAGATRVLERVPDSIPYQGQTGLLSVPAAFVPRFVWPGKPVVSGGVEVTRLFYDGPANSRTSNTLLLFGDAYWIFGVPAVLLIALFFGAVLAIVDSLYRSNAALLVQFGLLPTILNLEANVRTWMVATLQGVFVLTVLLRMLSIRIDNPAGVQGRVGVMPSR